MVKTFKFDLDLPENVRWNHILNKNKHLIPMMKKTIDDLMNSYGLNNILLSTTLSLLINYNKKNIKWYDEIYSISQKTNIEFNKILIMQLIYEMSSACTAVVTKVKGKNTFFRTMDWPLEVLKKLTIKLQVYKNKKLIAIVPTWIGCVGFFTSYIPNNYAIAINYKKCQGINLLSIFNNVKKIVNMYWPASYLIRQICENQYDINTAIKICEQSKLISPCYFTIFNEHGISTCITRTSEDYKTLTNDIIIQTNCDNNKEIPNILWSVERRNLVKKSIEKNNNNYTSLKKLTKEICVKPIINEETVFITIINEGKLNLFIP